MKEQMKLQTNHLNNPKNRHRNNLESMKGSDFVFDYVHLLYYKCHKTNLNRGGSYKQYSVLRLTRQLQVCLCFLRKDFAHTKTFIRKH